jgi:DNA-binding GntR family transcriptional regulator
MKLADNMQIDRQAATAEPVVGYGRVAAQLRQDILDGSIASGSWLRLQAIAARCGVSVQPVREALQQLCGEGLIEILPNRGARVRGLDRQRLVHIYEVREAVESFMARRFAEEASLSDLRRLEAIQQRHDAAVASGAMEPLYVANREFHNFIVAHGDNPDIIEMNRRYGDLCLNLARHIKRGSAYLKRARRDHHAMLEAFHRRDPARAAELASAHARAARQEALLTFHPDGEPPKAR